MTRSFHTFMGAVSWGSFATVGENTQVAPPTHSPRLYLAVEIGQACQLHCRHCIYQNDALLLGRPRPEVLSAIKHALRDGMDPFWITMAGKEPTLFERDLLDMAQAAHAPGRTTILMTNGLRLAQGSLLWDLIPFIDCFDVSLDGDQARHEWMRGPGTFKTTMQAVDRMADNGCKVGIIATHTGGQQSPELGGSIVRLAGELHRRFGADGQVSLSISPYFGVPGDPMTLCAQDIITLLRDLREVGFPCRILYTAQYAHLWKEVADALGIPSTANCYDIQTGFPIVRSGWLDVVLFNQTPTTQLAMRVSKNGDVFLGCNHLVLGSDAQKHRVGTVLGESQFAEFVRGLLRGEGSVMGLLGTLPDVCSSCERLDSCGGGDRLSGLLFRNQAVDPWCSRLSD